MSRVLVLGASRGIGLETVKAALAAGHSVRAFSRSADSIGVSSSKLEKRSGDALSQSDLAPALADIDTVIQALGVPVGREMLIGPVNLFSASTRTLIEAMNAQHVQRLIAVTGYGAGDSRQSIGCLQRLPFRLFLGRAYDDKDEQERLIRASGLDWTIVRPTVLTNGARSGRYKVLTDRNLWRNGFVSRADVADFMVREMDDNMYVRKAPVLAY